MCTDVIESTYPVDACRDINALGAPFNGVARSAQSYGTDEEFLYYTSGSGAYVHRFRMPQNNYPPLHHTFPLPQKYDFIVGLEQLPLSGGPLFMITTSTLHVVNSSATATLLDLSPFQLSTSTMSTSDKNSLIFLLTPESSSKVVLHTVDISLSPPSTSSQSIALPSPGGDALALSCVQDDNGKTMLALLVKNKAFFLVDPVSAAVSVVEVEMPPDMSTLSPLQQDSGYGMYFADASRLYVVYFDPPAYLANLTDFQSANVRGNFHLWL